MNNLPEHGDTIAALATAAGSGGIGIVRLSGGNSHRIAETLTGRSLTPRHAHLATLKARDGKTLDEGVVVYYPNPGSFTGEDVVELQCHGSPIQLQVILRECLALGSRQAQPGEFSQRAFLNGKIDLLQAEAIADLIASDSEAAARSAVRSLEGEFSRQVDALLKELIALRVFIEAAIDFPEEEIDFIADSDVGERILTLKERIHKTLDSARRGQTLRDGLKLVIAGEPNAGKSSLLNRLAETDTAIVTDIPGTTRDVLREQITICGVPLHVVDTAGLREATDAVEREGVRRARAEMSRADHILLVVDDSDSGSVERSKTLLREPGTVGAGTIPVTLVHNKCDLSGVGPSINNASHSDSRSAGHKNNARTEITLSAKTGAGLDLLRKHLLACAGFEGSGHADFSARQRHIAALERTEQHIDAALQQLQTSASAELVAEDLRYAQDSLGSITGQYTSDDLLGEIFSSFCIGK